MRLAGGDVGMRLESAPSYATGRARGV